MLRLSIFVAILSVYKYKRTPPSAETQMVPEAEQITGMTVGSSCVWAAVSNVRLVGGRFSTEGRVEVRVNGDWGTVCDRQWDTVDAEVSCRSVGQRGGRVRAAAFFSRGSGSIHLTDVACTGEEKSLLDCPVSYRTDGCSHAEDAGVVCDAGSILRQRNSSPRLPRTQQRQASHPRPLIHTDIDSMRDNYIKIERVSTPLFSSPLSGLSPSLHFENQSRTSLSAELGRRAVYRQVKAVARTDAQVSSSSHAVAVIRTRPDFPVRRQSWKTAHHIATRSFTSPRPLPRAVRSGRTADDMPESRAQLFTDNAHVRRSTTTIVPDTTFPQQKVNSAIYYKAVLATLTVAILVIVLVFLIAIYYNHKRQHRRLTQSLAPKSPPKGILKMPVVADSEAGDEDSQISGTSSSQSAGGTSEVSDSSEFSEDKESHTSVA